MMATLASGFNEVGIDLPHSQYTVIRVLLNSDKPLTQGEIASILCRDKSAIKRTIDILERKGFVIREARNGNSNFVKLTPKTMDLMPTIIKVPSEKLKELFGDYTEAEIKAFTNMLEGILKKKNSYNQ